MNANKKNIKIFTFVILTLFLSSCGTKNMKNEKMLITASIIPQKFFIEQISDTLFDVNVMVPPGASPASYEPTPKQMMDLSNSNIYFRIGHIPFEKAWMKKISSVNKNLKIIDTSEGMTLIYEEENCCSNDEYAKKNSHTSHHSHSGYNPHIWLSPDLVKQQSEIIYKTLCEFYPEYELQMQNNFKKFIAKIDSVNENIRKRLEKVKTKKFIVFHPVWTYFANDYGLEQQAIEQNGKEASAKQMAAVISFAKKNKITHLLVQKEFDTNQAETIAEEINGKVVIMNPLGYNWFETMELITAFFEE